MQITKPNASLLCLVLGLSACSFDSQGYGTALAATDSADADDTGTDGSASTDAPDPTDSGEPDSDSDGAAGCDDPQTLFVDADADGFGDPDHSVDSCGPQQGYVDNDLDCDDGSSQSSPDSIEVCDGADNDCDGGVDEFSSANAECGSCTWGVGPGGEDAFAHCDEELSWDDARAVCQSFGGDLAVASSAPVYAFIHGLASGDHWIGLADRDEEGRWVWVDGEDAMIGGVSVGFDGWQTNQPDGVAGEDCGLLVHSKGWADVDCSELHVFACQLPL